MNYIFLQTKNFNKDFEKLDYPNQKYLIEKLEFIIKHENPFLLMKKIKGYKDIYRFKIGKFRILLRLIKNEIHLLKIGWRKDIYKKFKYQFNFII